MKAIIVKHDEGEYESYYEFIDGVFIVDDDFDLESARREWMQTWRARRWKNGHGSGETRNTSPTISFADWFRQTHAKTEICSVEVNEYGVEQE